MYHSFLVLSVKAWSAETNTSVFQGEGVHVLLLLIFKFKSVAARMRYYSGGTCTTLTKDVKIPTPQFLGLVHVPL